MDSTHLLKPLIPLLKWNSRSHRLLHFARADYYPDDRLMGDGFLALLYLRFVQDLALAMLEILHRNGMWQRLFEVEIGLGEAIVTIFGGESWVIVGDFAVVFNVLVVDGLPGRLRR